MRAALSRPNHLPKASLLPPSPWGLGLQHRNFRGIRAFSSWDNFIATLPARWAPGLESSHFIGDAQRKLRHRETNSPVTPLGSLSDEAASLPSPHSQCHPPLQVTCHHLPGDIPGRVQDLLGGSLGIPHSCIRTRVTWFCDFYLHIYLPIGCGFPRRDWLCFPWDWPRWERLSSLCARG